MFYYSRRTNGVNSYKLLKKSSANNNLAAYEESLSTHIGVGFNHRNVDLIKAEADKGVTFAYKVGLDLLLAHHFSVGFRWNGMGNVAAYESVPVAWDQYGNVTRYEQRPTQSDEFSLGFFTFIAGIRF